MTDFSKILDQAKELQAKMKESQERIKKIEVTGISGGGEVKVKLNGDEICEIWIDVQKKSLGPSIKFNDDYKYFWSYIPHFIHSPFYVYAYAFGDCLVNSLFNVYESKLPKFEDKYITLLESGGNDTYDKLLKPFGLNPKKKDFWQKGVNVIENLIDQLEE